MADGDGSAGNGAHTDFRDAMSYGDYLDLDRLLDCQNPQSEQHDEVLFIVIHQATELWMKLTIHELKAALAQIVADDLGPAFKMLARVSRIQAQLIQSWDVLSTLTPADYMTFRDRLGQSSGFQSYQYRMIEFLLGNKNAKLILPHAHREDIRTSLEETLARPSIYDESLRLLSRRGLDVPRDVCERDWTLPYRSNEAVRMAWRDVYRDTTQYWDLYELAEKLVDLEDWFRQWRFRHVTTVERIIGHKRGTGGTTGVSFLKRALDVTLFPELWELRTEL